MGCAVAPATNRIDFRGIVALPEGWHVLNNTIRTVKLNSLLLGQADSVKRLNSCGAHHAEVDGIDKHGKSIIDRSVVGVLRVGEFPCPRKVPSNLDILAGLVRLGRIRVNENSLSVLSYILVYNTRMRTSELPEGPMFLRRASHVLGYGLLELPVEGTVADMMNGSICERPAVQFKRVPWSKPYDSVVVL